MEPTALEILELANQDGILTHAESLHAREVLDVEAFEEIVGNEIRRIVAFIARGRPGTVASVSLCGLALDEWRARLRDWCSEIAAAGEFDDAARGLAAYLEDADDVALWWLVDGYVCDVRAPVPIPARRGR